MSLFGWISELFCIRDFSDLDDWLPPICGTGTLTEHYNPKTRPTAARTKPVPSWDCRWG